MTKQFGKMFEKNKHPSEYSPEISDYLWNWISMVLSRTMDTAIIHIKDPSSQIGKLFTNKIRLQPDFVEER